MAEEENLNASDLLQLQQCSSPFLEINCRGSGVVRRFSVGTKASFALQLINQKLDSEVPSAAYIEAFKEGEEPICFGPSSALVDFGNGWKLQTVKTQGHEKEKKKELDVYEFHDVHVTHELKKDNGEFVRDAQHQLEDHLQEVEKPLTSYPVSDIELHSEKLDLTETFTTDKVFDNRDELIKWARDIGKSVGTVIVIKKSGSGIAGRTPRISFACERYGKYRVAKRGGIKLLPTIRLSGTKKCGCPLTLKGVKLPKDDQWKIKVQCGFHNHPLAVHSEGHTYGRKLTLEEEEIVHELSRSGLKPKEVLDALKERDKHNAATMPTIYCARQKLKLARKSVSSQCKSC